MYKVNSKVVYKGCIEFFGSLSDGWMVDRDIVVSVIRVKNETSFPSLFHLIDSFRKTKVQNALCILKASYFLPLNPVAFHCSPNSVFSFEFD